MRYSHSFFFPEALTAAARASAAFFSSSVSSPNRSTSSSSSSSAAVAWNSHYIPWLEHSNNFPKVKKQNLTNTTMINFKIQGCLNFLRVGQFVITFPTQSQVTDIYPYIKRHSWSKSTNNNRTTTAYLSVFSRRSCNCINRSKSLNSDTATFPGYTTVVS